ncbi:MAG TPA: hypothetical protein PLX89_04000 [Verrucomicrobiota bacterium]|nr:hypothetical protein [Verrucomicrobiales bacterium]HRI12147.1 hypothetical protein [Verrucomicrobiota bacterium]
MIFPFADLRLGLAIALLSGSVARAEVKRVAIPERPPAELKPYASLASRASIEPSGMVKSRLWPDLFWTLNDSGDEPRIFPVHKDGSIYRGEDHEALDGIRIPDAVNVDWEDLATDDEGHLIIGDIGNRDSNNRRDFCLYFVQEPHPGTARISVLKKVFFRYPDQTAWPSPVRNFDSEAIFFAHGKVYLLTKHRSDQHTKLYRFDSLKPFEMNVLTLLDEFDVRGQVTAADATPDGRQLAVLTYDAIWLFEVRPDSDAYFDGSIRWLPFRNIGDCESICFDGPNLIISSEEEKGDLYEVPIGQLEWLRR